MIYTWKVLVEGPWGAVGDIIEVELKVSEYDQFKADSEGVLERYIDEAPALGRFGAIAGSRLPGIFKDRMKQIRDNYPGARGMLNDSKFNWSRSEH